MFSWTGLLSEEVIAKMLREHVLNKWLIVLQDWLDQLLSETESLSTGIEELIQWYMGWKSIIPVEIRERPEIEEVFKWALEYLEIKVCYINN